MARAAGSKTEGTGGTSRGGSPRTGSPRARNPRGSGANLRADLLTAADAILDETGDPDRVTVRGVAAAVGVTPNAVYLHFSDREALLAEVAISSYESFAVAVREIAEREEEPIEALFVGNDEYCRLALERPGHYRLLFRSLPHPRDPDLAARLLDAGLSYFQVCVDGCAACIDAGVLDAPNAEALAGAVWALQHGWSDLALSGLGDGLLPAPRAALELLIGAGYRSDG